MSRSSSKTNNQKAEKAIDLAGDPLHIYKSLASAVTLEQIAAVVHEVIKTIIPIDGLLLNLIDYKKDSLVCHYISLPDQFRGIEKTYLNYRFYLDKLDANSEAYNHSKVVYVDSANVSEYGENTESRFERWLLSQMVVVPLMSGADSIGTLALLVQNGEVEAASVEEVESFLDQIIPRLHSAYRLTELEGFADKFQSAVEEQQRFIQFINDINNLDNTESIYRIFSEELLVRFGFNMSGIVLEHGGKLELEHLAVSDESYNGIRDAWEEYYRNNSYGLDINDGATSVSFVQNSRLIIRDVMQILDLPMSSKDRKALEIMETPRTFLFMPIRRNDKAVGVLWLFSLKEPVAVSEEGLDLVELLCNFLGTSLENAELYSRVEDQNKEIEVLNASLQEKVLELHDLATHDRLTGLHNFGYFQEELARRISEYRRCRGEQFFSIIILDIDHFKRFNDTYGHEGGNIALKDVSKRFLAEARKMDLVCRYGGEEFVAILPKCHLEGARLFAERVRESIASRPVETDVEPVPVTASLGCAEYMPNELASSFIQRADEALYRAKEGGRNRVEVAHQEYLSDEERFVEGQEFVKAEGEI